MNTQIESKHVFAIALVAIVWTMVVIGFSTSMGERPLRLYDWGPPAAAGVLTIAQMLMHKWRAVVPPSE